MDPWALLWCAVDPPLRPMRRWRRESEHPAHLEGPARAELAALLDVDGASFESTVLAAIDRARAELAEQARRWGDAHIDDGATWQRDARQALNAPWAVVAGTMPAAGAPAIAIVGTRRLNGAVAPRVRRLVESIVRDVGVAVVSGGALGIDRMAHDAALECGVPAVIALAGGLAHAGPASHRPAYRRVVDAGGALVTQRPPSSQPRRFEFVRRNQLIAALASVVIVVRAPRESGALVTAEHALAMGRPVLAVPGEFDAADAAGCNALLAAGALPCTCPADVLAAMGTGRAPAPQSLLPGLARLPDDPLGRALADGPQAFDALVERSGMAARDVAAALTVLELDGIVSRDPDGRWRGA